MSVTINVRTLAAFAAGLAVACLVTVTFRAWQVDAAPGDTDTTFVPITPCRLIDTRDAPDRVGPLATLGGADTRIVTAHGTNGNCAIPTDAVGLTLNVTAVDATAPTFLTIWPGGTMPTTSNLNPNPGEPPTPNSVVTKLSAGDFRIFNLAGSVDVIVDVAGYSVTSSLADLHARVSALEAADGISDVSIVTSDVKSIAAGTGNGAFALCPSGKIAIGGGFHQTNSTGGVITITAGGELSFITSDRSGGTGWRVIATNSTASTRYYAAVAVCA